jgi:citrate lyase subunit beta / citryl-CoA lyase
MINSDLRSTQSGQNRADLRTCLIVSANDREEFSAALISDASALFLRLGNSREESQRRHSRAAAKELLRARVGNLPKIYVEVAPVETETLDRDLAELIPAAPDGILLEDARSGASIQHLSCKLAVLEAECGLSDGAIEILALAGQSPAGVFGLGSFANASARLTGLVFDEDGLRVCLARPAFPDRITEDGPPTLTPISVARSLLAIGAAAAGVAAIDSACPDDSELAAHCRASLRYGFSGKMARSRAQLPMIDRVFGGASPRPEAK